MNIKWSLRQLYLVGARWSWATPGRGGPLLHHSYSYCVSPVASVLLLANLLTSTFASQRGFHAFFLARFQVKGVALYFFNNVFLLHFTLETAQSVFEGLTLLQSNFRQTETPPSPSGRTLINY
jgi:hypothetical protein